MNVRNDSSDAAAPLSAPHAAAAQEVLERLDVRPDAGLDEQDVGRRRDRYGVNALPEVKTRSWLSRLGAQLADPLVLALLVAAGIALFVGVTGDRQTSVLERYGDAVAILLIVFLNAVLGLVQEQRAESALSALQQLSAPRARVRREGKIVEIVSGDVVVGDVLLVEAGDAVAADARIVRCSALSVDESILTGESVPASKLADADVDVDAPPSEQKTMLLSGTNVTHGKAVAVVVAVGVQSTLGRIGALVESVETQRTPLEERLERFGRLILRLCVVLSAVLLGWGLFRGEQPIGVLLLEAVSLAVAAIPEGLPAITTITLALGMQRMARQGAIVRRLPAVETLGAATVIATDKTGTLTQNEMTVRTIVAGDAELELTGIGYRAEGKLLDAAGNNVGELTSSVRRLFETGVICNDAQLVEEEGELRVIGDPTEGALITAASKVGIRRDELRMEIVVERPFDSDRKRMSVVARVGDGDALRSYVKGSLDSILAGCHRVAGDDGDRDMTESDRERIKTKAASLSDKALRVLAFAQREVHSETEDAEAELTFVGLMAMMDPPREGVREAVLACRQAGIRAVMITGDHRNTAIAIAREIGMWDAGDEAIQGTELSALDDDALASRIQKLRVFARTTPEQKLRIVRAFKSAGHVVAMTGDGVNDAPALREAHIGVAMGHGGTDVARQASEMVLSDDNFATIVRAVHEGRAIYKNIQKFIFFLLSANAGLVITVFALAAVGWLPLIPLMILWINLVTNGAPALALGMDPPGPHLMKDPPRSTDAPLLDRAAYAAIAFVGVVMAAAAIAVYVVDLGGSPERSRALAFSVLAIAPLVYAVGCRSFRSSIVSIRPRWSWPVAIALVASTGIHLMAVMVPSLQPIFRTHAPSAHEWGVIMLLSVGVLLAYEAWKLVRRLVSATGGQGA